MNWQQITSIGIVLITAVLLIKYLIKKNKNKKNCSNCELAKTKASIRFAQKKSS
jgi:hypothetical protein